MNYKSTQSFLFFISFLRYVYSDESYEKELAYVSGYWNC